MNRIITKHELWNLSNEQIAELTKGRLDRIVLKNGEYKNVYIQKIIDATHSPHLFVGFLTGNNYIINLKDIDCVELINAVI